MYSITEIDCQTLKTWMDEGKQFRLIDVRSLAEINQGVIDNGEPLPLNLLPLKTNELNADDDIIFYCRTGARSAQACYFLKEKGYDRVYNLRGGIMDWVRSGNQVVAPAA